MKDKGQRKSLCFAFAEQSPRSCIHNSQTDSICNTCECKTDHLKADDCSCLWVISGMGHFSLSDETCCHRVCFIQQDVWGSRCFCVKQIWRMQSLRQTMHLQQGRQKYTDFIEALPSSAGNSVGGDIGTALGCRNR